MDISTHDDVDERIEDNDWAGKYVTHRWELMDRHRKQWKSTWDWGYKAYRSRPDPRDSDWQSNLFIPRTFDVIETIKPRLVQGLFAQRPSFSMLPVPDHDTFLFPDEQQKLVQRAKDAELLIDHQLETELLLRQAFQQEWCTNALLYGTAPAVLGWDPSTNQALFKVIDPYDFWVDPAATKIEDAQDAMHEVRIPIDVLRKRARDGIYDQETVDKLQPDSETPNPADQRRKLAGYSGNSGGYDSRIVTIRQYARRNRLVWLTKQGRVLRNTANTLLDDQALPYVVLRNIPIPGDFWGMGWPEILKHLQLELNDVRSLRVDNLKLSICKMYAVSSEINDELFLAAPGAIFKVADPSSGFRVIEQGDISPAAYQEEAQINADIDRTTGQFDYTRGKSSRSGETATGINLIQTEANVRFALALSIFEDGILDLVRKLYLMDQIWLKLPRAIRHRDQDGMWWSYVSEDAFQGSYDIAPVSSATIGNKDVQRQTYLQLMQTIGQVPQFAEMLNYRSLLSRFLQLFDLRDTSGLIKSEQQ